MKKIFLLLVVAFVACSPYNWPKERYAVRLSGSVGCPPEEIKILDDRYDDSRLNKHTKVECRGKIYYCLDTPDTQAPVCKEAVK